MFRELNPLLHSELRLAVMSILISVESADFVYLRERTGATAGTPSVQTNKLKKAGYTPVPKGFKGRMPCPTCAVTAEGSAAFAEYVDALADYIGRKQCLYIPTQAKKRRGGDPERILRRARLYTSHLPRCSMCRVRNRRTGSS